MRSKDVIYFLVSFLLTGIFGRIFAITGELIDLIVCGIWFVNVIIAVVLLAMKKPNL